jgi:phospholipid/cholesterol/gamma-HCH transport system ATP-binding protein
MALIEYRGVCKRFDGNWVLDHVDLAIAKGETVGLLGPSGGGKTLMLKALVGLMRPDAGQVLLDGVDVPHARSRVLGALRRRIGFVFQASALFDSLTVGDNVAYALRLRRRVERDAPLAIAQRVAECLSVVGLAGIERLMPEELSGGMRKRVAIARALATRPEVLLYDEPTVGLDPANVARILALIAEVNARLGTTSLVVTHDRDLAFGVADRIALLLAGKIAWTGATEVARRAPPAVLAAFLSGHAEDPPPDQAARG